MTRRLSVRRESWRLAAPAATPPIEIVLAEVIDGALRGRGEARPYAGYGETIEGIVAVLEAMAEAVAGGIAPEELLTAMPAGGARSALDAALWELTAKSQGKTVWRLAGIEAPRPLPTAFTLVADGSEAWARALAENAARPILKLVLAGGADLDVIRAARAAAPAAKLIVAAASSWTAEALDRALPALAQLGVALVEQPLPAGADEALAALARIVPIGADESCRTEADLDALADRYDFVTVRLDKSGGLTEALRLTRAAQRRGLRVLVGGAIGTSLAMAPALVAAQEADLVQLDGTLHLLRDRQPGLRYDGSTVYPPKPNLWG
jgi:L-alanine-DL-glutamate epimerase-like enolase superfamily enzyme